MPEKGPIGPEYFDEVHEGPGTYAKRELAFSFRFEGVRGRIIVHSRASATSRGQRDRDVADEEGRQFGWRGLSRESEEGECDRPVRVFRCLTGKVRRPVASAVAVTKLRVSTGTRLDSLVPGFTGAIVVSSVDRTNSLFVTS